MLPVLLSRSSGLCYPRRRGRLWRGKGRLGWLLLFFHTSWPGSCQVVAGNDRLRERFSSLVAGYFFRQRHISSRPSLSGWWLGNLHLWPSWGASLWHLACPTPLSESSSASSR